MIQDSPCETGCIVCTSLKASFACVDRAVVCYSLLPRQRENAVVEMTTLHPSSADEICVGCAVKNDPGQLAFNPTAPVKQENSAAAATQTLRPPFVAVWQPMVGSSLDPIRLDLRCDVFGMMLASKPPATAAKIVIAQERVSQGHLHPSLGPDQSLVLQFETTASRQLFVDAVKYWKLDADGIAALRQAVAAAASIGVTGVLASEDVKPPPSSDAAVPSGPSSRELRLPAGVEIISSAQRAKERAWVAHDSGLRQLFAGLVTQGLITEEAGTASSGPSRGMQRQARSSGGHGGVHSRITTTTDAYAHARDRSILRSLTSTECHACDDIASELIGTDTDTPAAARSRCRCT
jgi:hypothetical protein